MSDFKFYFLLAVLAWAPHASRLNAGLIALVFVAAAGAALWRAK